MKYKKRLLLLSLSGFIVALLSIHWTPPPPPPPPSTFEQNPPQVANLWVQKLAQTQANGNNMIIKVQYQAQQPAVSPLPQLMSVFVGPQNQVIIHDDGLDPDQVAGDGIYSAYVTENIQSFQQIIDARAQALQNQSTWLTFSGHVGIETTNPALSTPLFDDNAFNNFQPVLVNPILVTPTGATSSASTGCFPTIIKQQSLFITDTTVVEDPSRTFNVVSQTGNPVGIWTFGTMISNMANFPVTGVRPRDLLSSWFKNYVTTTVVNGQSIKDRENVVHLLIAPWLVKIGLAPNLNAVNNGNWLSLWNTANDSILLANAPFKLTAIVNRLDLRGNSGYAASLNNSGETRFIFTLIDPNAADTAINRGLGDTGMIAGRPPLQFGDENPADTLLDWKGMNVIFEYGNTESTLCDVISFANQWVNLSSLPFPSALYNSALDTITRTVIDANKAPSKPNKCAINRIRTNERIFDTSSFTLIPPWQLSDWEFRQFQLQSTGLFAQVPLTNTPRNSANAINAQGTDINGTPTIPLSATDQDNLLNWAFSSGGALIPSILSGNYTMPDSFAGIPLLSGGARVDFEYVHYLDLNLNSTTAANYVAYEGTHPVAGNMLYKNIRQQLSLGTCQGCHAGETKTIFTQVLPIGYHTPATYWNATPDFSEGKIDERFSNKANPTLYPRPHQPENVVRVSAFLTGRDWRQPGGVGSFQDDSTSVPEDLTDPTLNGLFYVFAPDDYATNKVNLPTVKFGYNDLERRRLDLAALSCTSCTTFSTLALFAMLTSIPLPFGGH